MAANAQDPALAALKRQIDSSVRVVEAIIEGSMKIRESQLEAAAEAHAALEATRKQLEKVTEPQELWRIQGEWLSANLQQSLAYWRKLQETVSETQACVAKCLCEPGAVFTPPAPLLPDASRATLLDMIDDAYKRWLESTKQFYAAPIVSAPQIRQSA